MFLGCAASAQRHLPGTAAQAITGGIFCFWHLLGLLSPSALRPRSAWLHFLRGTPRFGFLYFESVCMPQRRLFRCWRWRPASFTPFAENGRDTVFDGKMKTPSVDGWEFLRKVAAELAWRGGWPGMRNLWGLAGRIGVRRGKEVAGPGFDGGNKEGG
jgi:hypothetical protein